MLRSLELTFVPSHFLPLARYFRDGHVFFEGAEDAAGKAVADHVMSFPALHKALAAQGHSDTYVATVLRPYLKQVARFALLAAFADSGSTSDSGFAGEKHADGRRPALHKSDATFGDFEHVEAPRAAQLLRNYYRPGAQGTWHLDFALDAKLDAHLVGGGEGAMGAKWAGNGAGGLPDDMHVSALALAERVQTRAWPRATPPASLGGWELLHNEAGEACAGPYDACGTFFGKGQAEVAAAWPHEAPPWPAAGAPFDVEWGPW